MDPVTLIVAAMAAGAMVGLRTPHRRGVKDPYAGLNSLVSKRFAGRPEAELVLAEHEKAPGT